MSRITLILSAVVALTFVPCLRADPALDDARKALEADLAALHQAGEPSAPADLANPPVPDASNGVLDLRAAYKAIDQTSDTYQRLNEDDVSGAPSAEQLQMHRALAAENPEVLSLVTSALDKGHFDWQIKATSPVINILLPDLGQVRSVSLIVQASAMAAHSEGDDDLALKHIEQLLSIADAVGQQPFLISHLVDRAIANLAIGSCQAITPALDAPAGSPARKHTEALITALLDETATCASFLRSLRAERVSQSDTALAIATGALPVSELTKWTQDKPGIPQDRETAGRIALEDARTTMAYSTQWIHAAGAPDWPTAKARFPAKPSPKPDRYFARLMTPALERAVERHYTFLATRRMAAIALAARCYALDHVGKLPASLADLAPKYLPAVPTDPFTTGQPMRYLPEQGIIYSIGSDGKDDGGKETKPKSRQPDIVVRLRP